MNDTKELQAKWTAVAADKGTATANKFWFFTARGVLDYMLESETAFAAQYWADKALDKHAVMIGWLAGFNESIFAGTDQFRDGLEEGTPKTVALEIVAPEPTPIDTAYDAAIEQIRTEGFYETADVFVPTMPVLVNVADTEWGDMFVSPTNSEADGWRDRASSGIKMSKLLTLGEAAHKETVAEQAAAAAAIETPLVMKGDIIREGTSDFDQKYTVNAFDLARFQTSRQIEVKGGAYGRYWIKVGTWWQVQRGDKWVALFKK